MQKNKMKLKSFSLFLILFLLSVGVSAQQRSISGTVTDSEGEPIIGATVLLPVMAIIFFKWTPAF